MLLPKLHHCHAAAQAGLQGLVVVHPRWEELTPSDEIERVVHIAMRVHCCGLNPESWLPLSDCCWCG